MNHAEYDAIVIGAGNGGLTAACTLAQGGFRTLLLEQHNVPGGYATSFCRGRFEFEVALHQLSGLGSKEKPGPLRTALDSLGVTNLVEWVEMKNLYRVMVPGYLDVTLPANREEIIEILKGKFPEESKNIEDFFALIYRCWNEFQELYHYNFDTVDINARLDTGFSAEKYPVYSNYAFKNLQEVLDSSFTNPLLKLIVGIFSAYSGPPKQISLIDLAIWLFLYIEYGSYQIKNGSQALSNAIVKRFQESGGDVRFNCGVTKIIVENGAAVGVVTESGDVIGAKNVVSNASPLVVYTEMMDRADVPKGQMRSFRGSAIGPSTFILFIALDCDHSQIAMNESMNFILGPGQRPLYISCYNVDDPDCSPPGTSLVTIVDYQNGERWLSIPPHRYCDARYEGAEKILGQVEKYYPGLREHIEEIEVATPLTNVRFTRAPGGAIGGFNHYGRHYYLFPMDRPRVRGLHFVGAWTNNPGGFHPTLMNGRAVGLDILEKERISTAGMKG